MKMKRIVLVTSVRFLFHLSAALCHAMTNGSYMTTDDVQGKWRNRKETLNASQNRKNVYSDWRRLKLDSYTSFLNPGETLAAEKIKCIRNSSDEYQEESTKILLHEMPGYMLHRRTLQKLNELDYETLPHPPDSPDISPTNYNFIE